MKRVALLLFLAGWLVPLASAQDRFQLGAYADYELKGGFINFRLDPRPASFAGFVSSVDNLRTNKVSGTLYPAAGLEGHLGPVGLRLETGDEMYFSGGTHHNVRVAFGPFIRF